MALTLTLESNGGAMNVTAALFALPRDVEIRWLGHPRMGMFTRSTEAVADALAKYPANVYITVNELQPGTAEKRGMPLDTVVMYPNRGRLTANEDIRRRLLLPFDSDPERPTGTSATEEQRALAFQQSGIIQQTLCALGWPEPAIVSTGNGACRYFACDLPADHETDSLLRSFYACAAKKFSVHGVKLDTSIQNRARVMRVPGSLNVKAGRLCELQHIPAAWRVSPVTPEMLRVTTEQWRKELGFRSHKLIVRTGPWTEAHVEAFMDLHGLDYRPPVEIPAGTLWVCCCPFNPAHSGTSPALILTKAGWLKWACKHNSCQMTWRQFVGRLNALTGHVYRLKKETTSK
jgi:hypothetical protein